MKTAVETLLAPAESNFINIEPFLYAIGRDDLNDLLNDILMRRELLSGHNFLSEDHVYLHQ
ncbi:hypothetical protein [Enterobacter sp. 22452]|uniref:hypothetical protein n=1 Tax=Enterobacter TaxID=547 RepID=UPI003F83A7FB